MTRHEKIQLLKAIKAGKKSLKPEKPEAWMSIRVNLEGYHYLDSTYTKSEIDKLISDLGRKYEVSVIWINEGGPGEPIPGATPLTLNIQ